MQTAIYEARSPCGPLVFETSSTRLVFKNASRLPGRVILPCKAGGYFLLPGTTQSAANLIHARWEIRLLRLCVIFPIVSHGLQKCIFKEESMA
jgi:hypothetical protein